MSSKSSGRRGYVLGLMPGGRSIGYTPDVDRSCIDSLRIIKAGSEEARVIERDVLNRIAEKRRRRGSS